MYIQYGLLFRFSQGRGILGGNNKLRGERRRGPLVDRRRIRFIILSHHLTMCSDLFIAKQKEREKVVTNQSRCEFGCALEVFYSVSVDAQLTYTTYIYARTSYEH